MSKKIIALIAVLGLIILGGSSALFFYIGQGTNPQVEVTRVVTEQVAVPAELPTQYAVDPLAVAVGQANATQAEITRIQAEIVVAQAELKALVDGNATLSQIATKEAELNDLIARAEALIDQSGLEVENLNELAEAAMTATPGSPSTSSNATTTTATSNTATAETYNILVVEDNSGSLPFQNYRTSTTERLQADIVGSRVDSSELCPSNFEVQYDLTVMDISLGSNERGGIDCLRLLLENNPNIKVIIHVAAEASHPLVSEALNMVEGSEYVRKPNLDQLSHTAKELLGLTE